MTTPTSNTPLIPSKPPATHGDNTNSKSPWLCAGASNLTSVVSGATFGAALVASGVYDPAIIIGQLELKNWHMMQAFLAATASSAVFIALVEKLGHAPQAPRQATTINLFARHDANIIGGSLLGLGMSLAGGCPGTVLAQVGVGISSGYYAMAGGVAAGMSWVGLLRPLLKPCHPAPAHTSPSGAAVAAAANSAASTVEEEELIAEKPRLTIQETIHCRRRTILASFEALCVATVGGIILFLPSTTGRTVAPAVGGLLIGLSQLWSLLSRRSLLGASTAFEELGKVGLVPFGGARPQSAKSVLFATGIVSGALAVARLLPGLLSDGVAPSVPEEVTPLMAVVGGFLVITGGRLAGGCTSGHGISGMAMFSISSFVTIASALGTGFLVRGLFMPAVGWA